MSCKRYGSRLTAEYCMHRPCRWLTRIPCRVIYTHVLDTWAVCQHLAILQNACLFFHEPPRGFRPLVISRTYSPWSIFTPNMCFYFRTEFPGTKVHSWEPYIKHLSRIGAEMRNAHASLVGWSFGYRRRLEDNIKIGLFCEAENWIIVIQGKIRYWTFFF